MSACSYLRSQPRKSVSILVIAACGSVITVKFLLSAVSRLQGGWMALNDCRFLSVADTKDRFRSILVRMVLSGWIVSCFHMFLDRRCSLNFCLTDESFQQEAARYCSSHHLPPPRGHIARPIIILFAFGSCLSAQGGWLLPSERASARCRCRLGVRLDSNSRFHEFRANQGGGKTAEIHCQQAPCRLQEATVGSTVLCESDLVSNASVLSACAAQPRT